MPIIFNGWKASQGSRQASSLHPPLTEKTKKLHRGGRPANRAQRLRHFQGPPIQWLRCPPLHLSTKSQNVSHWGRPTQIRVREGTSGEYILH